MIVFNQLKNKKILVIRMFGLAELYAKYNSVTYLTDNEEKYNKFLNLIKSSRYTMILILLMLQILQRRKNKNATLTTNYYTFD